MLAEAMMQTLVHKLSEMPFVFDALRWILEGGHLAQKRFLRKEIVLTSGPLLDLGCGTGALANIFPEALYAGIDVNPHYIQQAKKKNPHHRLWVMDGRKLSFPDNSHEMVLISGVLHHLDDQDSLQILHEVKRILKKPGGALLVWEDIPIRRRLNLIGKMVQHYDNGKYIREAAAYQVLIEKDFQVKKSFYVPSGVCEYSAMVATPRL